MRCGLKLIGWWLSTLIGGSLLLVVLALHESRPLFEKAKKVHRSISMRMSSRILGGSTIVQSQIGEAYSDSGGVKAEKQSKIVLDDDPEHQNHVNFDEEATGKQSSSEKWEDEDGR